MLRNPSNTRRSGSHFGHLRDSLLAIVVSSLVTWGLAIPVSAQENPYQVIYDWGELPGGRAMGVVTGVQPAPDGQHIWVLERCGTNQCAGSDLNPLHKLDKEGNTVKSIGAGVFAWPHGFDMDADGIETALECRIGCPHTY